MTSGPASTPDAFLRAAAMGATETRDHMDDVWWLRSDGLWYNQTDPGCHPISTVTLSTWAPHTILAMGRVARPGDVWERRGIRYRIEDVEYHTGHVWAEEQDRDTLILLNRSQMRDGKRGWLLISKGETHE